MYSQFNGYYARLLPLLDERYLNETGDITATAPVTFSSTFDIGLSYNATNLKVTSSALNTIQDIDTTATPQFTGLGLNTASPQVKLHVLGGGSEFALDAGTIAAFQSNNAVSDNCILAIISGATSGESRINFGDLNDDAVTEIVHNNQYNKLGFLVGGSNSDGYVFESDGTMAIGDTVYDTYLTNGTAIPLPENSGLWITGANEAPPTLAADTMLAMMGRQGSCKLALIAESTTGTSEVHFGIDVSGGGSADADYSKIVANHTDGYISFTAQTDEVCRMLGGDDPQILAIDGTALKPVYSNIGDENTGIWFSAADTINWSTSGTERMELTTTYFRAFNDADNTCYFGRAAVGHMNNAVVNDYAGFTHLDRRTLTDYAFLAGPATVPLGHTYINCMAGRNIYFRRNNSDLLIFSGGSNNIEFHVGSLVFYNDNEGLYFGGNKDTYDYFDGSNRYFDFQAAGHHNYYLRNKGGNFGLFHQSFNNGTGFPYYMAERSNSDTMGTKTVTDDGDNLFWLWVRGVKGSGTDAFAEGAKIAFVQDGSAAATNYVPTNIVMSTWSTTAENANQLVLHNDGKIGIGTNAPGSKLTLTVSEASTFAAELSNTHSTDGYGLRINAGDATEEIIMCRDKDNNNRFYVKADGEVNIPSILSGATQGGAGAAAGELWKTASHATLPDNVVMIGV